MTDEAQTAVLTELFDINENHNNDSANVGISALCFNYLDKFVHA